MERFYGFKFQNMTKMEHALLYPSIDSGKVDIIDVYATDAKIVKYNLKLLKDDKHFFPDYYSILVTRLNFIEKHPKLWREINRQLLNKLNDEKMTKLNALVELDKNSVASVAKSFLQNTSVKKSEQSVLSKIWKPLLEHLYLVLIPLIISIFIGVPLGITASKYSNLKSMILSFTGVLQTIPSLALLCFLIPLLGIGLKPALCALTLYSLLPITKNTYVGLENIDPNILEMETVLRMSAWQKIKWIEIPLILPYIVAGIKTALIINIGTATIAAFIGAGGLGELIVQGLYISDTKTLLSGAIPASLLAVVAGWIFVPIEKWAKIE